MTAGWTLTVLFLGLSACDAAAKKPDWTEFAGCAAAYRANADLVDPDRPAAMKASMAEIAEQYRSAAVDRYWSQQRARGGSPLGPVEAQIAMRLDSYRKLPRAAVEREIESCPQLDR